MTPDKRVEMSIPVPWSSAPITLTIYGVGATMVVTVGLIAAVVAWLIAT